MEPSWDDLRIFLALTREGTLTTAAKALGVSHPTVARRVQALIHAPMFRVYASGDPIGVQVGGAVKNVIAIATGVCDALDFGTNARAAAITRSGLSPAKSWRR